MSKEEKIREMCKLIILHISSKKFINTSFAFRNIFSNLLGFIVDEASIIHELLLEGKLVSDGVFDNSTFYKSVSCTEKGMLKSDGLIDKSPFYKSISCTEKGKKYYNDNIHKIDIIESDFPDKKLEMLQFYLGLKRPS